MTSSLRRRAFTLIELLIVITIIGILAVALIPRLTGGPARARDAQRQSDLQQLATALEFMNSDKGGYPFFQGCVSTITEFGSYLTSVPTDPNTTATAGLATTEITPTGCATGYFYSGLKPSGAVLTSWASPTFTATGYILAADLETETTRGTGVYNVASAFTVATNSTAATNLASGTSCTTSACAATSVIYVVGR